MNDIWIVIAAFNEEKTIAQVINSLKIQGYENIIIVDDGSTDNTYDIAKRMSVSVLQHCINRGQGATLQTGIDFALTQNAEIIVTFDADGQHLASEVRDIVQPLFEGYNVALGSRFLKNKENFDKPSNSQNSLRELCLKNTKKKSYSNFSKTNVPLFRKIVLKGGAFICQLFYGIRLTDTHNGFRALSRRAAEKIRITADRMDHGSQILDEIARHRLSYKEVPVTILYSDYSRNKGQSSFNAVKIFFKMLINKFVK